MVHVFSNLEDMDDGLPPMCDMTFKIIDKEHDQSVSSWRFAFRADATPYEPVGFNAVIPVRWSRLFGQFGGEVKLIPGFDHAASWSVSVAGACPGNGRFSFAP